MRKLFCLNQKQTFFLNIISKVEIEYFFSILFPLSYESNNTEFYIFFSFSMFSHKKCPINKKQNCIKFSGARIVRIATHPEYQRMGYGSRTIQLLQKYYEVIVTFLSKL